MVESINHYVIKKVKENIDVENNYFQIGFNILSIKNYILLKIFG
jgi:hypothetical protein